MKTIVGVFMIVASLNILAEEAELSSRSYEIDLHTDTRGGELGLRAYVQTEHGGWCDAIELAHVKEYVSILNTHGTFDGFSRPCEPGESDDEMIEKSERLVQDFLSHVRSRGGSVKGRVVQRLTQKENRLVEEITLSIPSYPAMGELFTQIEQYLVGPEKVPSASSSTFYSLRLTRPVSLRSQNVCVLASGTF